MYCGRIGGNLKKIKLDGCLWCPFNYEYTISKEKHITELRCSKMIVRNKNYKLIRKEDIEIRNEKGELESYCKFPEWCPLENY